MGRVGETWLQGIAVSILDALVRWRTGILILFRTSSSHIVDLGNRGEIQYC